MCRKVVSAGKIALLALAQNPHALRGRERRHGACQGSRSMSGSGGSAGETPPGVFFLLVAGGGQRGAQWPSRFGSGGYSGELGES
jgi:hypothetical protein